jgi:hypothetical protein
MELVCLLVIGSGRNSTRSLKYLFSTSDHRGPAVIIWHQNVYSHYDKGTHHMKEPWVQKMFIVLRHTNSSDMFLCLVIACPNRCKNCLTSACEPVTLGQEPRSGFDSRHGQWWGSFSSPPRPDQSWGPPNHLSSGYLGGVLLRGVRRPGCEADDLPPSSTEVKNAWSCTSTPPALLHGMLN